MFRVAWRSLRAHKGRLVLSTIAVVLGVAFVGGSFIFSDTLKATFTELFAQTSSDVVVSPVGEIDSGVDNGALTLPESLVGTVADVDGVNSAVGGVFVAGVLVLDQDNKPIGASQAPNFGVDWSDNTDLSPLSLVDGRGPSTAGEIAVDSQTADKGELTLGEKVRVLTPGPTVQKTVVGVFKYGSTGNLAGASLTAFTPAEAQRLLTAPGRITQIDVKADEGVSQQELAERVRAVTPPTSKVQTGEEVADESASEINAAFAFFDYLILAFAAISLLVGIFLIVNTFSMLVAQRARELALLRALGASRRQVSRSLLTEAVVVGLVGSTLGFGLGVLLAIGLQGLLTSFGLDLPESSLVIEPRTVVVCYLVGMIVTLVSAWFPARRASRVPPVAAMRDTVAIPSRSLRTRTIAGTVVTALGLLALFGAVTSDDTAGGFSLLGLGALLTLLGVAVVAPVLARPLVRALGWPVRRISRLTGRMAVDNASRNRTRTAGTASALMIGLAVVSTFAVTGASVNASIDSSIDESIGADYLVQPTNFANGGFSPEVAATLRAVDGVGSVTAIEQIPVKVDGKGNTVTAVTPATADQAVKVDFVAGDWNDLGPSTIGLDEAAVKRDGLAVGDTVTVQFETGTKELELAVVYDGNAVSGWVIDKEVARSVGVPETDFQLFVALEPGADPATVRAALDTAVEAYPNVNLQDQTEFKESTRQQVNGLLAFIYVLLALSLLIAILGIVNTLALSVIERTREIGLLRAVGMSRTQVKRMIRWESVIIACIGAILGVLLGVLFGAALQKVLESQGIQTLAVPTGQLVAFVVIAGLVGVLAAWRPARRAARLDVLKAISTE